MSSATISADHTATAETAASTAGKSLTDREVEEIIRVNLPLVGHLVREMGSRLPSHIHRDDLTSAGMAAILGAARSFDPERGIPFHRFAATRIRGALLDELRTMDWASRSVRTRARQNDTVRQQLTQTLGRTPTAAELAAALGTTTTDLNSTENDVQRAAVLSLHGFATGTPDDLITESSPTPEDMLVQRERIGYLHHAISALPDRLRTVVTDYYLNERPMAEIAEELGVTESRISQLRSEALTLMRDGLNHHLDPQLVAAAERPNGSIAKRRAAYYSKIAERSSLNSRLAHTDHEGMPAAQRAA